MKSKKKFLSLLVFAPLLVGCGNKVEAPKFAEYGKQMASFDAFKTELLAKLEKTSIKKSAKLGSYELKSKESYAGNPGDEGHTGSSKTERDNKVISQDEKFTTASRTYRYSVDDLALAAETQSETKNVVSNANESSTTTSSSKSKQQFQVGKINKKDHILYVDVTNKKYQSVKELGSKKAADEVDKEAKDIAYNSLTEQMTRFITFYLTDWGSEMKSKCKFYKNDKIYTAEIKYEVKQTFEKEDYKCVYNYTVQVDLTEGNFSSKSFEEEITTNSYKASDGTTIAKGDVVTNTELASTETTLKSKKQSVKAVDVSKFTLVSM